VKRYLGRAFALGAWLLSAHAFAQPGTLEGGWIMDVRGAWEGLEPTDAAEQAIAEFDRAVDDPSMRCVPPGLIRTAESRAPLEIVEQDHQIHILYESFNIVRRIDTSGRGAPEWIPASPLGYSVGTWRGDELVVETTHLTPHLFNDDGFPFSGGPQTRVTERFRGFGDRMVVEFTVEDSENLRVPVTRTLTYDRVPDQVLLHFHCDPLDATGWRLPASGNPERDLRQWRDLRPSVP